MSTSQKTPASIRQGDPGSSHENAKAPLDLNKGAPDNDGRNHANVSGGGGEKDRHHTHDPDKKGDTRKAQ